MAGVAGYSFGVASAFGRLLWRSNIGRQDHVYAAQGENAMLSQSRRATAFAAELLLPAEAIAGLGSNENELWKLSEIYGISRVAARWHWKHVGACVE
jgi:Zn-dependent peptidase ImmA (M78 family)